MGGLWGFLEERPVRADGVGVSAKTILGSRNVVEQPWICSKAVCLTQQTDRRLQLTATIGFGGSPNQLAELLGVPLRLGPGQARRAEKSEKHCDGEEASSQALPNLAGLAEQCERAQQMVGWSARHVGAHAACVPASVSRARRLYTGHGAFAPTTTCADLALARRALDRQLVLRARGCRRRRQTLPMSRRIRLRHCVRCLCQGAEDPRGDLRRGREWRRRRWGGRNRRNPRRRLWRRGWESLHSEDHRPELRGQLVHTGVNSVDVETELARERAGPVCPVRSACL